MFAIWIKVRTFIGDLWGKTTTTALAAAAFIFPILETLPAEVKGIMPGWLRITMACSAAVLGILRFLAPPPKAVTVKLEDEVLVDHVSGAITIIKPVGETLAVEPKSPGV